MEFGKPSPKYKIDTPPFYAAWATPVVHDTRAGLRINARCQVVDFSGSIIPGLYCAGESAGGFSLHGLARCTVQGRVAGKNAADEVPGSRRACNATGLGRWLAFKLIDPLRDQAILQKLRVDVPGRANAGR